MARRPCQNTSRFNQLPRDILAEIFVRCLPKVSLWPVIDGSSTKDVAPLLLCNVCAMWRAVALATPRLWQTLFLDFKRAMPKSKLMEEAVAMTHIWIGRSGALSLTLSLRVKQYGDNRALGEAMLNALLNYELRWEHVGFYDLPIPPSQLEHMPCLRTLIMSAFKGTRFPFASCPKLASIRWRFKSAVSSAPLPWHRLTHIHLYGYTSTPDMIFVIRSCPKLIDLNVMLDDVDEVPESLESREIVVNKSLRKLDICVFQPCNPLLRRLTLPALTDIRIELPPPVMGIQKELLSLFSRSKCKLNRMSLENCGFDDVELLECLKHDSCTDLMDLKISGTYSDSPMFTDSVLLALTDMRPVENNLLLPKLACLLLESCLDGSPGKLGTMILSRCTSQDEAVQLKHLNVYSANIDEQDVLLLELAKSRGLDVSIDLAEDGFLLAQSVY